MRVLVPRTRAVGVRLSPEEFSALEKFCLENGARSISEVARTAITTFIQNANRKSSLAAKKTRDSSQIQGLEEQLKQLTAEISRLNAGRAQVAGNRRSTLGRERQVKNL